MRVNQRQRPYDTREEFLDFRRKLNTKYAEAQTVGHELFSKANHSRDRDCDYYEELKDFEKRHCAPFAA